MLLDPKGPFLRPGDSSCNDGLLKLKGLRAHRKAVHGHICRSIETCQYFEGMDTVIPLGDGDANVQSVLRAHGVIPKNVAAITAESDGRVYGRRVIFLLAGRK
jgi:hypothetical protein